MQEGATIDRRLSGLPKPQAPTRTPTFFCWALGIKEWRGINQHRSASLKGGRDFNLSANHNPNREGRSG
jgi:hypothetical protein